ncbi:hypothetical protein BJP35_4621 [Enterobacter sp. J49]|nr:hypothetical protein BJP35_4621 [Enterobacter sp. J49]
MLFIIHWIAPNLISILSKGSIIISPCELFHPPALIAPSITRLCITITSAISFIGNRFLICSVCTCSPINLLFIRMSSIIAGLGYGVFAALNQPAEKVFVWVVLIALLFAGINGLTMFMMGKGSIRAVRVHLSLAFISLLLTVVYLLAALSGTIWPGVNLTAALVSVVMLLLSGFCIRSPSFYKMLLFTLHNRAWRQQIRQTRNNMQR